MTTTITIMANDGSSHREILATHLEADAIAEREALSVTNIVVTHDGDVFRRVTADGNHLPLTHAELVSLGLA